MNEKEVLNITFIMISIGLVFVIGIFILDFFISPQTGNIGEYQITMPGMAWIGVPIFLILVLILYVKNRM